MCAGRAWRLHASRRHHFQSVDRKGFHGVRFLSLDSQGIGPEDGLRPRIQFGPASPQATVLPACHPGAARYLSYGLRSDTLSP